MSLREFYRHISTCRNVYCKLCIASCEVPVKVQIFCNNNPPPGCMSKPFPGRETGNLFGVALGSFVSQALRLDAVVMRAEHKIMKL